LLEPSAYTSGGIRLYTIKDVNRLIFIRRLAILGLSLEEIKQCLGDIPDGPDRRERAQNTLQLLRMQKEKLMEQRAKLDQLERDIRDSEEKVSRCLNCRAVTCPEQCSSFGQVL